jgi:hypothetical protein
VNADEAISSWTRCFPLCRWLSPCPPSQVSDSSDGSTLAINPSFHHWKPHDQIILSALLSSLSIDVMYLVVDYQTSSCVWRTFEKAFASLSNSHIMQLHGSFQDFW